MCNETREIFSKTVRFNIQSTIIRSFQRWASPINQLDWYWRPHRNNRDRKWRENTKQGWLYGV